MIGRINRVGQWLTQKSLIPASRVFGGGGGTRVISKALNHLSSPSKIGLLVSSPIIATQLIKGNADAQLLLDLTNSLTSSTFAHRVIFLVYFDTPFAYVVTAIVSAALLIIGNLVKEARTLHGRVKLLEENFKGSMVKENYKYAFLCIEGLEKIGGANHRADWVEQSVKWKTTLLQQSWFLQAPGLYKFFVDKQKAVIGKKIEELPREEYLKFCELATQTKEARGKKFEELTDNQKQLLAEFNKMFLRILS